MAAPIFFSRKHLAHEMAEKLLRPGALDSQQKWSGLFEQIFLIYKWKTCGITLPLGPLAAAR